MLVWLEQIYSCELKDFTNIFIGFSHLVFMRVFEGTAIWLRNRCIFADMDYEFHKIKIK